MQALFDELKEKVLQSQPLSKEDCRRLFYEADLPTLSTLASLAKAKFHDPKTASYRIMAILNFTNICVAKCDYCAFYKLPQTAGGYTLSAAELSQKIDSLRTYGIQLIGFNGGFNRSEEHTSELQSQR